jgi:hypothetical protein
MAVGAEMAAAGLIEAGAIRNGVFAPSGQVSVPASSKMVKSAVGSLWIRSIGPNAGLPSPGPYPVGRHEPARPFPNAVDKGGGRL